MAEKPFVIGIGVGTAITFALGVALENITLGLGVDMAIGGEK